MKKLHMRVHITGHYDTKIQVPDDFDLDQAIDYAKDNLEQATVREIIIDPNSKVLDDKDLQDQSVTKLIDENIKDVKYKNLFLIICFIASTITLLLTIMATTVMQNSQWSIYIKLASLYNNLPIIIPIIGVIMLITSYTVIDNYRKLQNK